MLKIRTWFFCFCLVLFAPLLFAGAEIDRLQDCFTHFKIDSKTQNRLFEYFASLPNALLANLESELESYLISSVTIQEPLHAMDALHTASKFHHVLFENSMIRIIEDRVAPDEIVPFHIHQWDSIVFTIQGSKFLIENMDGDIFEDAGASPIVERFPGDLHPLRFKNIGSETFQAISFEMKLRKGSS